MVTLIFKRNVSKYITKDNYLVVAFFYEKDFLDKPFHTEIIHSTHLCEDNFQLIVNVVPKDNFVVGYYFGHAREGIHSPRKNKLGIPIEPFGFNNAKVLDFLNIKKGFQKWKVRPCRDCITIAVFCPVFHFNI
jgi:hypothetical protein